MLMSDHSRFAYELNKLILGTSLSPEDIVVELNRRSFPLPMRTFSYWLQGYFLPRSEAAFQLVAILENILKVSDNRLSDALLEDLSSGASFVPGEFAEVDFAGTPPPTVRFPATFNETVDWEANLIQKVVRDEVYLSADHKSARFKATILARVPSVPNPTFFFQLLYKDGIEPGREEIFYDLAGVTVKAKNIVEEGDVTVCSVEFALPDDVVPGDVEVCELREVLQRLRHLGELVVPEVDAAQLLQPREVGERGKSVLVEPEPL